MIQLGVYSDLVVEREAPPGLYLLDDEKEEVLLPNKFVTSEMSIGSSVNVFVYTDSEDRLVATTQRPYVTLGGFAVLMVKDVNAFGAFLDWGLDKDLFVPFKNQANKMEEGKSYLIHLYEDEDSDRLVATSKYTRFLSKEMPSLEQGDEVDLLIGGRTDLGRNVIVNDQFSGLIYSNQIFKKLEFGDRTTGYVSNVREDGKLDISLEPLGHKSIEPNAQIILDFLKSNQGKLMLHDKSDPEEIKEVLSMSKKNFKKAVGTLYRQKLVLIQDTFIELIETSEK